MEVEAKLPYLTRAKIVPLWVLVFFTGWFIMQAELVGARALTPYFGNSIYVWGSVIAVFMLALALGYGAGGRFTQKFNSHWFPVLILALAGITVAATVTYQAQLCSFLAAPKGIDAKLGVMLASVILYAIPMILAGMISPFAVHLAAGSRSEVGSRAGSLYAISTIGSFVGSLATSFLIIPSLTLPAAMLSGGILALAAALITGISLSLSDKPAMGISLAFAVIALVVMLGLPQHIQPTTDQVYAATMIAEKLSNDAPSTLTKRIEDSQKEATAELMKYGNKPDEQVLFNKETPYNRVQVTQQGPIRTLTFGESGLKFPQTSINLLNVNTHIAEYTGVAMAPILYKQNMKRVLIIGLGGGDIARGIESCYPNAKIDIVEIDPAVVKIAQKYFFWKPGKNVTVYTMDGRTFLGIHVAKDLPKYDWVVIDVFGNDTIPFHLTTAEFYATAQRALADDGVLEVNTWFYLPLYSYQARTMQAVYGQVDGFLVHRAPNVLLVVQNKRKSPMTPEDALRAQKKISLAPTAVVDMKYITSCLLTKPNWVQKGEILTDLWAPVEKMMQISK